MNFSTNKAAIKLQYVFLTIFGVVMLSCQTNQTNKSSESKFFTDSIYSEHLKEYRKHNVYLPKGFDSSKNYPIMYSTDGGEIKEKSFYKRTLDSLIDNHIIDPIILIKSHSNTTIADSSGTLGNGETMYLRLRFFEYVDQFNEGFNDPKLANRFENHMKYFSKELIAAVETKFNQNPTRSDRYFYGVSNGAGFGMHLLNAQPDIIGTYLCFSTFGGNIQSNDWRDNVDYPKLYIEYGTEEPSFLKEDSEFLKAKYKELGLFAQINAYDGGHDYKIWNQKFIEILKEIKF